MNPDFYEIKTAPAGDPVSFAEASAWARDINVADTALVTSLISAATLQLESMTNRVFVSREITGSFSWFEVSNYEKLPYIEVRRSPLIDINFVYINGEVVPSDDYIIKKNSGFSRILFKESYTLDDDVAYPIVIIFTAGYASVPDNIKACIKQIVLFWYENRGDISTYEKMKLPFVAMPIIRQYRIVNTFG